MAYAARTKRTGNRERYFWIGLGALGTAIFVALILLAGGSGQRPRAGDHWHARYVVIVCGLPRPHFPVTPGGVHTHGDGVIHIHPQTRREGGKAAHLARFFASAGVSFGRDGIAFPDGTRYRNGDRCPDGRAGSLRLLVNGKPSDAFDRFVPRDGDVIVVEFGPPSQ